MKRMTAALDLEDLIDAIVLAEVYLTRMEGLIQQYRENCGEDVFLDKHLDEADETRSLIGRLRLAALKSLDESDTDI